VSSAAKPRPTPPPYATDGRVHPASSGVRAVEQLAAEHCDFDEAALLAALDDGLDCFGPLDDSEPDTERRPTNQPLWFEASSL